MDDFNIMIIKVNHRIQKAPDMQEILTKYGCNIKVRLGLHEMGNACSNQGLILLQVCGDDKVIDAFREELCSLDGVNAKCIKI